MQHIDVHRLLLASSVFFACMVGIVQAQCTRPTLGENMVFSAEDSLKDEFQEGSKVRIKCDFGYQPEGGSPTITCQNGQWSDVTLICARKNCGSPGEVDNGHYEITDGTLHLSKAVFYCNKGHILVGRRERTCRDGTWTGRKPVCEVVKCGEPPEIGEGEITTTLEESYDYSSVVQYRCKGQLTLVGARGIVCSENGTWQPDPPQCKNVECETPVITNALRTGGARPPYTYRSFVTYACKPGFIMDGEPSLTCGIDSKWSSPYPTCKVSDRAGPTAAPAPPAPDPTSSASPATIAGIVVGVVVLSLLLLCGFIYWKKRSSSQAVYSGNVPTNDDTPQPRDKSDGYPLQPHLNTNA